MEIVLTIAGSDSSGGAGIQQDLKVITAHGCYGATVITSVTSQNTLGVQSAMAMPPSVVASQLSAVLSDLKLSAIKIGMLPDRGVAEAVVDVLGAYLEDCTVPVVYDPVMVSSSGFILMEQEAIDYIAQHLFPLCTLVTPNLPEADVLKTHVERRSTAFLLKGGHAEGPMMTDRLITPDGRLYEYSTERIESANLHGTGCTLSSAIASNLALGRSLPDAVGRGKDFVTEAIRRSVHISIGHGHGPLVTP